MSPPMSTRLSPHDAAFLYFERPTAPLHIGSLGIFEGEIPFDRFVAHIESRLPLIPRYRQRLVDVPLDLSHPSWCDDPDFDIRNHIFNHRLPVAGGDRELREFSTDLFATQLLRDRPLWEIHVIHGLAGSRSAMLSKVHHCLVDGVSGIELLLAVVDITPEPAPPPQSAPWQPAPLPGPATRVSDALAYEMQHSPELIREAQETLVSPGAAWSQTGDFFQAIGRLAPWLMERPPETPFNATPLTEQRQVGFAEASFIEIRDIRTALGGTVNDVVLSIVAGALRTYGLAHGCDVSAMPVRVGIPVNVRRDDEKGALGNRVSMMLVTLPLHESDPAARHAAVRKTVDDLKGANQAGGMEVLMRMGSNFPANLQHLAGSMSSAGPSMVNLICTNVPGPMIPLYSVGHLLLAHYPLVPLSFNMGLGVGVTSYNQRLFFGVMAEPNIVPDYEFLGECFREAFLELRTAAGVSVSDIDLTAQANRNGGSREPQPVGATSTTA
jgi:diacylglycerol O-acyltransferase / wax synthase